MLYIYYLFCIIFGIFNNKKKLSIAIILIFMIVVFGLNNHHLKNSLYYNMDFENYYTLFNAKLMGNLMRKSDIGFQVLVDLFNKLKINFTIFRLMIAIVGYSLIISTLNLYSKNVDKILICYLIYPFINDVIQIRNFLSFSIIIYSIRYLVYNKKNNQLKFIICLIIASSIHIANLFFIIFLIAKKISQKNLLRKVILISIVGIVLSYTNILINLANILTKNPKVFRYLSRRTTIGMVVVLPLILIIFTTFMYFSKKYINIVKSSGISLREKKNKKEYFELMKKTNILCLLLTPFLVYDLNYLRLYRNILILNYVFFIETVVNTKVMKIRLKYIVIIIVFLLYYFISYYLLNKETQIFPIFNDNYLLEII